MLEKTKNTTRHTPGPWEVRTDREFYKSTAQPFCIVSKGMDEDSWLESSDKRWVCRLFDSWDEQAKADAALIASAPALLEALQWATDFAEGSRDIDRETNPGEGLDNPIFNEWVEKARAAIAQAAGEEVEK